VVHGGFPFLRVSCRGCKQTQWVDLRDVKRPPETPSLDLSAQDRDRAVDARPWHARLAEGLGAHMAATTNDEASANAIAIAKRLQLAAGDQPKGDMFMAIALLVAYTIKAETTSRAESDVELDTLTQAIDQALDQLWAQ
jgi:hypothetical protein